MTERKLTITDIKQKLLEIEKQDDPFFNEIKDDTRKGVQLALKQWQKRYDSILELDRHHEMMLQFERQLNKEGYRFIAGIDEVGRGPLAGPVVAAAVILPDDMPALPINDSKKLSKVVREELYDIIMRDAQVGIGIVENDVIDSENIYQATKLAMKQAVQNLEQKPDALLVDAMTLPIDIHQQSLIKGDTKSYSIAAASIIAKVYRDRLMAQYAVTYPEYGFESNSGYGTKIHLEGLENYGATPIHRRSFEPIKSMFKKKF